MPDTVQDLIRQEATKAGVPIPLALAVAEQESGFNPTVVGPKLDSGEQAVGTFQVLPSTAKARGFDPYDPRENIRGGVGYLRELLDQNKGDLTSVLKTYGGVVKDESYVPSVLGRLGKFKDTSAPAPAAKPTFNDESVPVKPAAPAAPPISDLAPVLPGLTMGNVKGIAKAAGGTVSRLGEMVRKHIPSLAVGPEATFSTTPVGPEEQAGATAEPILEFMGASALTGGLGGGAMIQAPLQAATSYGVSKAQGASETGSRINAAMGAFGPVVSEAMPLIGQKIRDRAVTQLAQRLTKGLAEPGPAVSYALKTGDVAPDVKQAVGIVKQAAGDILDAPIRLSWGKWLTTLSKDAAQKGENLGQALKGSLGQQFVPTQPINTELDALAQKLAQHFIPGKGGMTTVVRNQPLLDSIQELKDIVNQYPGGQISIQHLSELKRTWDDAVYTLATEGKVGVDASALANTAKKKAMETGANSIRRILDQQAPDIAALNEAASHAYRLQELVKNVYKKQPGMGAFAQSAAHTAGSFAGYGLGQLAGHPLIGMGAGSTIGGRLLVRAIESPAFQTLGPARKNLLAKAIAAGDQAALVKILTPLVSATVSQETQPAAAR